MAKTIADVKITEEYFLNDSTKLIEVYAPEIVRQAEPGQFVNVQVCRNSMPLLRRPLGIAGVDREKGTFSMIYRIIGDATKILAEACKGDTLSIVGPLGRGFDLSAEKPLLVGGGLGLAPLLFLADKLEGSAYLLMGGRNREELFWRSLYEKICRKILVTTDDGSEGTKGTVMELLPQMLQEGYDCVYVCGPVPMMKAVAAECIKAGIKCQVSLEKYMACGLGACLSCSFQGIGKRLKVCTDGPVFWAEEVKEW
ncbi:MAG: dihydroorotate dehydrogenase electron transfer subunit [Phascolarctobacterium sp.]|nr:dihydroorotate dehydrogenase electron transfer subunit [Phascolarctobacterium sp.]